MSARRKRERRLPDVPMSRGVDADGILRVFECGVGSRTVEELVAAARAGDPYDVVACLDLFADAERGQVPGVGRAPEPLREFALDVLLRLRNGERAGAALGIEIDHRRNEKRETWHRDWDLAASVRERRAAGETLEAARLAVSEEKAASESMLDRALKRFPGAMRLPRVKKGRRS